MRRWLLICLILLIAPAASGQGPAASRADQQDPRDTRWHYFSTFGTHPATASTANLFPRVWEFPADRTLQLRGRIDTDSIWTSQSAANEAIFGDLGSVTGLRRARVGVQGHLGPESRYIAEIDLASGSVVPRDVFVGVGNVSAEGEHRLGHYREPFSLEGGTSANYLAFMERSTINSLDPARAWGGSLFRAQPSDSTLLAIGLFHNGSGPADVLSGPGATAAITSRLTWAPIDEDNGRRLLHLGVALSERFAENQIITVNQLTGSPLLDLGDSSTSPFTPTINIPASYQQLFNLQLAVAHGPLWFQAEWYGTLIPPFGGGLIFYHGSYVSCGYFLTGEHRGYMSDSGVLGSIVPQRPFLRSGRSADREHGWGAWELAARLAYADFFSPHTPLDAAGNIVGVRMPQATFGVNWYLADRVRILFDYSYCAPDDANLGTSEANIFATRLNVYW